jgi:hypothetical protein
LGKLALTGGDGWCVPQVIAGLVACVLERVGAPAASASATPRCTLRRRQAAGGGPSGGSGGREIAAQLVHELIERACNRRLVAGGGNGRRLHGQAHVAAGRARAEAWRCVLSNMRHKHEMGRNAGELQSLIRFLP